MLWTSIARESLTEQMGVPANTSILDSSDAMLAGVKTNKNCLIQALSAGVSCESIM